MWPSASVGSAAIGGARVSAVSRLARARERQARPRLAVPRLPRRRGHPARPAPRCAAGVRERRVADGVTALAAVVTRVPGVRRALRRGDRRTRRPAHEGVRPLLLGVAQPAGALDGARRASTAGVALISRPRRAPSPPRRRDAMRGALSRRPALARRDQSNSAISAAARSAPSVSTGLELVGRPISSVIAAAITSGVAVSKSMHRPAP